MVMEKDFDIMGESASLKTNRRSCYEDVDKDPKLTEDPAIANEVQLVFGMEDLKLNHDTGRYKRLDDLLVTTDEKEVQIVNNMEKNTAVTFVDQSAEVSDGLWTSASLHPCLKASTDRPDLEYRGAWLHLGAEGVHIMEVANPDPVHGRPPHGGFDRHVCFNCNNVENFRISMEQAGVPYQLSLIPSVFCRDPDGNGLEFVENSRL
ncbi:hypothetical protein Mapa_002538 [Marchantia paleacea]|nr:hypothetical protein Mapa_002538 [Marchantia paleacea]